ncbi:hypothetical protein ACLMAJ_36845 [Nocardia sp. KC 131]|uniref:hypothetical protein n=1 Tax=Nocardia arseniciresistens TaxID=3392119 RepID=UPI00398EFD5D
MFGDECVDARLDFAACATVVHGGGLEIAAGGVEFGGQGVNCPDRIAEVLFRGMSVADRFFRSVVAADITFKVFVVAVQVGGGAVEDGFVVDEFDAQVKFIDCHRLEECGDRWEAGGQPDVVDGVMVWRGQRRSSSVPVTDDHLRASRSPDSLRGATPRLGAM